MGWLDYINASPDLAASFAGSGQTADQWGQTHYQDSGQTENRPGVPVAQQYLTSNPDVATWAGAESTPDLDDAWSHYQRYGIDEGRQWGPAAAQAATTAEPEQTGGGLFDLPTLTEDIYPTSESGIDWQSGFGPDALKSLTDSINSLPGLSQQFGQTLQDQYSNLMKRSLGPEMFQGTLNQLANRGMLNSSVAGEALSQTGTNIMNTVGDRQYESNLQGLQQQMQLPGLLGQLTQLLQRSKSSDPLAPYQLAMNYY